LTFSFDPRKKKRSNDDPQGVGIFSSGRKSKSGSPSKDGKDKSGKDKDKEVGRLGLVVTSGLGDNQQDQMKRSNIKRKEMGGKN